MTFRTVPVELESELELIVSHELDVTSVKVELLELLLPTED